MTWPLLKNPDGSVVAQQVRASWRMHDGSLALFLFAENPRAPRGDIRMLCSALTFTEVAELNTQLPPVVSLNDEAAQRLIDDLWSVGLRPTGIPDGAVALAAKDQHITDLRRMAFDVLAPRLPSPEPR